MIDQDNNEINETVKSCEIHTKIGEARATVIITVDYGHGDRADLNVCEDCAQKIERSCKKNGHGFKRRELK